MSKPLGFEYEMLKSYLNKGIWARAGLVDLLIKGLQEHAQQIRVRQEIGLDEKEVTAALQIAVIGHIMIMLEDLAVLCKAISQDHINYYQFLDKKNEGHDLGDIIGNFYVKEIILASDEDLGKILSFNNLDAFEHVLENERDFILAIEAQMISRSRAFFDRASMFGENHHEIFRRYKHAGFPVLLAQEITQDLLAFYKGYEFGSLGFVSKEKIDAEVVLVPYSEKAVESYLNLKKDIFSFVGNILTYKLICIERGIAGLVPHKDNLFGINLDSEQEKLLDTIWQRIEQKYPKPEGRTREGFDAETKILKWYEDIEHTSKRVLG